MGKFSVLVLASTLASSVSFFATSAHAQGTGKATDLPECATIVSQCETAGFEPGEHKKTGKGLWADCVRQVAAGKTIAGVSVTQAEAKTCGEAAKVVHKAKKAAKSK